MRKGKESKILIVLLVLCLAGFGLLGAEAWTRIHQRQSGSLWEVQAPVSISVDAPVPNAEPTQASMEDLS